MKVIRVIKSVDLNLKPQLGVELVLDHEELQNLESQDVGNKFLAELLNQIKIKLED